jgi:murein hydrolase activator
MRRALVVVALAGLCGASAHAAPPVKVNDSALALAALDRRIADLDSEDQATRKEISELGPKIAGVHARAVSRGRSYYKLTRAGMLPVGAGFDSLVSHAMRVERARHTLEDDLAEEARLKVHGQDLTKNLEHVARDREALASQRTSMDAVRMAMEDEARRRAAFDKAFDSSQGAPTADYVAVGGPSDDGVGGAFAAARGKLLMPIAGRAEVRTAKREGADGPGLELLCADGSVVRAVYAGRVAFADRYGAYGRIVIVDHGDHYYTVSGNLGTVDVRVGDDISAGERLGTVGDDGAGPMLYFEVRHGSQTVPPGPWLGL